MRTGKKIKIIAFTTVFLLTIILAFSTFALAADGETASEVQSEFNDASLSQFSLFILAGCGVVTVVIFLTIIISSSKKRKNQYSRKMGADN